MNASDRAIRWVRLLAKTYNFYGFEKSTFSNWVPSEMADRLRKAKLAPGETLTIDDSGHGRPLITYVCVKPPMPEVSHELPPHMRSDLKKLGVIT